MPGRASRRAAAGSPAEQGAGARLPPARIWVLACALGEALGIALVAVTYAAIEAGHAARPGLWIIAAGAWEGVCLGAAQALILFSAATVRARWIAATMLGAAVGYALTIVGGAGNAGAAQTDPAPLLLALAGAALGLFMGALLGAAQWLSVRERLSPRRWIAANAVGWAAAMAVIMLAASAVPAGWRLSAVASFGAAVGSAAGICVGLATARARPDSGPSRV